MHDFFFHVIFAFCCLFAWLLPHAFLFIGWLAATPQNINKHPNCSGAKMSTLGCWQTVHPLWNPPPLQSILAWLGRGKCFAYLFGIYLSFWQEAKGRGVVAGKAKGAEGEEGKQDTVKQRGQGPCRVPGNMGWEHRAWTKNWRKQMPGRSKYWIM